MAPKRMLELAHCLLIENTRQCRPIPASTLIAPLPFCKCLSSRNDDLERLAPKAATFGRLSKRAVLARRRSAPKFYEILFLVANATLFGMICREKPSGQAKRIGGSGQAAPAISHEFTSLAVCGGPSSAQAYKTSGGKDAAKPQQA